jgi:hypothetical protein
MFGKGSKNNQRSSSQVGGEKSKDCGSAKQKKYIHSPFENVIEDSDSKGTKKNYSNVAKMKKSN